MTVKEFYEVTGGDYQAALELFMKDELIKKFVLKFADDDSYPNLKRAVEQGDIQAAFQAAHTLKGVAANLNFTKLKQAVSVLTEQLRPCEQPADGQLVADVDRCYQLIMDNMKLL